MSQSGVGKSLRMLREKCGYTQQQLANVLNIDRSTYSYYERGKTSPDIQTLITLASVFSVSLEELVGQDMIMPLLHDSVKRSAKKTLDNNSHIYDLKKDELQLIAFFRAMSPEKRLKTIAAINEINHEEE